MADEGIKALQSPLSGTPITEPQLDDHVFTPITGDSLLSVGEKPLSNIMTGVSRYMITSHSLFCRECKVNLLYIKRHQYYILNSFTNFFS